VDLARGRDGAVQEADVAPLGEEDLGRGPPAGAEEDIGAPLSGPVEWGGRDPGDVDHVPARGDLRLETHVVGGPVICYDLAGAEGHVAQAIRGRVGDVDAAGRVESGVELGRRQPKLPGQGASAVNSATISAKEDRKSAAGEGDIFMVTATTNSRFGSISR
jgi:hypothetical protein